MASHEWYIAHREQKIAYSKQWRSEHQEQARTTARERRNRNKVEVAEYNRKRHAELRDEVLEHYGSKCACCGETERAFLAIDHINGGGKAHRIEIGIGGGRLERWLQKNGYPEDFQILCHNCNQAKALLGVCPHQQRRQNGCQS